MVSLTPASRLGDGSDRTMAQDPSLSSHQQTSLPLVQRRGLAAELAREHGGVAFSWRRAVAEAVMAFESEQQGQGADGAS
ncbi:hypothetical protein [Streptomyces sp. NPDC048643]|uniref:hypothetical protein n=1 Tax=Streptomyces sp. NPDC048643 TaxID=3155637 RepID=UPI0034240BEC